MSLFIHCKFFAIFLLLWLGLGHVATASLNAGKTLPKGTKLTVLIEAGDILKDVSLVIPVTGKITRGQTRLIQVKEGHKFRISMRFKRRAILEAYGEKGDYYLLQFYQGKEFGAILAPQNLEFVVGEISSAQLIDNNPDTTSDHKRFKLDLTHSLDVQIKLTDELEVLGPFRKAVLEISQPLRTPPQSAFIAEMRKMGQDFNDRRFSAYAAARGKDAEGPIHEIRDLEMKETQQGSALISLRLPQHFSELDGFTFSKWAIPIDLWVLSSGQEGHDNLLAQYRYYVSSMVPSIFGAFAFSAIFYVLPLFFIHRQRQASKRWGKGVYFGANTPPGKTALGKEADILPMNDRQPFWLSPLWLGRSRRGEARMSSFQITIWTYLVFFVAMYSFLMNGFLIDINQGMLYLLGISGGGYVLSRMASARQDDQVEVILAVARDSAPQQRVSPAWTNLIMSGGRVDLPRLQILLFTVLTALYVGITAMMTFQFPEVPDGLLTLMGLSNGLYVLGKVTEPGLADKLAEVDLFRRAAVRDREVKEGHLGEIKNLVAKRKKDMQQLDTDLSQAQVDKKAELELKKTRLESELSELKKELGETEKAFELAKTDEKEKEKAYADILAKLNQALDKKSETVV